MAEPVPYDLTELLSAEGKCCICEDPLKDSERINFAMLDKFTFWKGPGWGNVLAAKDKDKTFSRAVAVVCDKCYDANKRGESVGEVRFALEVNEAKEIIYHPIEDLRDAPQIKMPKDFVV